MTAWRKACGASNTCVEVAEWRISSRCGANTGCVEVGATSRAVIRCYIGPVRVPEWLYDLYTVPGTVRRWRCRHRSHLLRLPCLRISTYDHRCGRHNAACWSACPREAR